MTPIEIWDERIERARELAKQYPASAEILDFYSRIAGFQQELFSRLQSTPREAPGRNDDPVEFDMPSFRQLLDLTQQVAPPVLVQAARDLTGRKEQDWNRLLREYWQTATSTATKEETAVFFCRAFLQPYAEHVRLGATFSSGDGEGAMCPFCRRKPGAAVLREEGLGGKRSLLCSFCLGEWEYRRLGCPACGEDQSDKLAVYTADDFPHIRVDACDRCKAYLKTVDLTKNGRAVPVVDEIAAVALDLWARTQGYSKLHANLMAM